MIATVLVFLGAGVGGALRHGVNVASARAFGTAFPWGTLTVNLVGSFVLGLLTAMSTHLAPAVSAAVGIGFCGALTTYSTFSYEILRLLEDRARFYAVANVGASLLGGFGAVGLGWTLGTWLI